MSAEETIAALADGMKNARYNRLANELRDPLVRAIRGAIEPMGTPLESSVLVTAITFVLSDFIQHLYQGEAREEVLVALTAVLARSVREPPAPAL